MRSFGKGAVDFLIMIKKITKSAPSVSKGFAWLLIAGFFSPLVFQGCLATSKEIIELRDDINQLRVKLQEVQINQADLTEKMSSIDLSMSALGEKLEENKNAMSLVATRLDDIESGISSKISRLESRMDSGFNRLSNDISKNVSPSQNIQASALSKEESNSPSSAVKDSTAVVTSTTETVSSGTLSQVPSSLGSVDVSPGALYRMAYDDFTSGRYESATATFKVFIEKYPKASLAPYAWYYMGESKYARALYDGAIEDFEYVIKNHPRSDMVLPSLYKKAVTLEKLNRAEDAKKIYSDIIKRYPSSQEAGMSSERLKDLSSNFPPAATKETPPTNKYSGEKE